MAEQRGRDSAAARGDLLAALFPVSALPPDEMTIAGTRTALHAMVASLERDLLARIGQPVETGIWDVLTAARLLDAPLLIDAAEARAALDRLYRRAWALRGFPPAAPLPVNLAGGEDAQMSDAALALLSAEAAVAAVPYRQLSAEAVHLLCWRIVAGLEAAQAAPMAMLMRAGEALLAEYDERQSPAAAAGRLAHLLDAVGQGDAALDPAEAGASLFVAALAARTGLDFAQVAGIAVDRDASRLAIVLSAAGVDAPTGAHHMLWLAGTTPHGALDLTRLESVERSAARTLCTRWAHERAARIEPQRLAGHG